MLLQIALPRRAKTAMQTLEREFAPRMRKLVRIQPPLVAKTGIAHLALVVPGEQVFALLFITLQANLFVFGQMSGLHVLLEVGLGQVSLAALLTLVRELLTRVGHLVQLQLVLLGEGFVANLAQVLRLTLVGEQVAV